VPTAINLSFEGNVSLPYEKMSKRKLVSVINKTCEALSLDNITVSVILMDNAAMRKLNKKYRKKDYATDVISFAYREYDNPVIASEREHLGDIFISLEKAKEQAAEFGVTFSDEMTRLVVHAFCHCVGYDHERSKKEEKIMQKKEDLILSYIAHA
jgi:probable rRNA maturation factor